MALQDTFRKNLIARRRELGLTTREVAARMGVSQPSYIQYELGKRVPGLDMVEKISRALEVAPAALLMAFDKAAA